MVDTVLLRDTAGYWDRYASGLAEQTPQDAIKDAFGWCQYSGHGPDDELLGEPATALELGSGRGNAVAALATKGVGASGIDVSPVQADRARERWGHLAGTEFVHGEVLAYLTETDRRWDAVYSIWGALWFTDPDLLLPLIHDRLTQGGRLVFSHAPAVPGSYGVQGLYGGGFNGRRTWVYRWAYEPEKWAEILQVHGFTDVHVGIEPAPRPDHLGTLIATARRI